MKLKLMLHFIQILYIKKGKTVCCDRFNDEDQYRFNECYHGIHFFMDKTSLINWWNEYAKDNIPLKMTLNWKVVIHCDKNTGSWKIMRAYVKEKKYVSEVTGTWHSFNNSNKTLGPYYIGSSGNTKNFNYCVVDAKIKLNNGEIISKHGQVWAEGGGNDMIFSGSYEMYP